MNIFSVYDAYTENKTENYKVSFGDQSKCSFPTGDNVEGRPIINKNSVCAPKGNTDGWVIAAIFFMLIAFVLMAFCFGYLIHCFRKNGIPRIDKMFTSNEQTPLVHNSSND